MIVALQLDEAALGMPAVEHQGRRPHLPEPASSWPTASVGASRHVPSMCHGGSKWAMPVRFGALQRALIKASGNQVEALDLNAFFRHFSGL